MKPHPTLKGAVIGDNGYEYPSNYYPGSGGKELDEAWEILDTIKPGVIPLDVRSYLAGQITGILMKYKGRDS
jgi:hypothetical protein